MNALALSRRAQTCYPPRVLLREYEQLREHDLTPDGRRRLRETCDMIEMYLEQRGVFAIDVEPNAPRSTALGVASRCTTCDCLGSFEREFVALVVLGDATFVNVAGTFAQDFARWLAAREPSPLEPASVACAGSS